MKFLALLALLALPSWGASSLIQRATTGTGTCGNPCTTLTFGSNLTPGSAVIIVASSGTGLFTVSTITNTASEAVTVNTANCAVTTGTIIMNGCGYILSTAGGYKTFTVNYSGAVFNTHAEAWEINLGGATATFDTAGTIVDGTFTTSHAGVALTLGGTDVIVQIGGVNTTSPYVSAVNSPYNTNANFTTVNTNHGVGTSIVFDSVSGTAPTWTTTSRPFAGMGVALKLTPGGGGGGSKIKHRVVSGN